jgi:hypothetical protein
MVTQRGVFGRRLILVQPMRMRVVNAEEFELPVAEFPRHMHDLIGRNFVIPTGSAATFFAGNVCVITPFCPARIPQHS